MRLLLTTPYDPGPLDPGRIYTHVKVVDTHHIVHDDGGPGIPVVETRVARGYLEPPDTGDFKAGLTEVPIYRLLDGVDPLTGDADASTHHTDLQADLSNDGEAAAESILRVLYQWLIDQTYYPGTIEAGD